MTSPQPPQLKITYFPIPVPAVLARLALTYGGIEFEDERITSSVWSERKDTVPLGLLPVLEIGNDVYVQSMAIARYAGRVSGLYPIDAIQALKVDTFLETLVEILNKCMEITSAKDTVNQREKRVQALRDFLPKTFAFMEEGAKGKYVLGDQVSLADLFVFNFVSNVVVKVFPEFSLRSYPKLIQIVQAVKEIPRIAAYLAAHA
ncbi:hypothetical protein Poli38472_002381 [Pythium oligandrum]|uniref:Glutathione S-transferase n=1 Tax=Pythium oligandrum TaxID=41045 RepID=A0A8K1CIQ3_PYTOL|nr:hypothetical protein Poli38472_002381 [Pythium oligandrum]|eukprot:TMW63440.1 hypothetical protein Poli38472_002381 [Pythium oligandrum]